MNTFDQDVTIKDNIEYWKTALSLQLFSKFSYSSLIQGLNILSSMADLVLPEIKISLCAEPLQHKALWLCFLNDHVQTGFERLRNDLKRSTQLLLTKNVGKPY